MCRSLKSNPESKPLKGTISVGGIEMSATEIKKGSWVQINRNKLPLIGQVVDTVGVLKIRLGTGRFIYEFKKNEEIELLPPPPALDSWIAHATHGKGQVVKIHSAGMVEVVFMNDKRKVTTMVTTNTIWQIPTPQVRM